MKNWPSSFSSIRVRSTAFQGGRHSEDQENCEDREGGQDGHKYRRGREEEMNKRKHEIICNEYPLYSGYSTQEAIRAWENGIDEQLDLEWYINGVLYRTSKKPVAV